MDRQIIQPLTLRFRDLEILNFFFSVIDIFNHNFWATLNGLDTEGTDKASRMVPKCALQFQIEVK